MIACPQCSAQISGAGRCLFCGYDVPHNLSPNAGLKWGLRAGGLGCGVILLAFLALLAWGTMRPSIAARNHHDHPALVEARELLQNRRFNRALESLQKAPSRSAYTHDLRGVALLGIYAFGRGEQIALQRANEAFRDALLLDNEVAPVYLHLAACQAMLGEKQSDVVHSLDVYEQLESHPAAAAAEMRRMVKAGEPFVATVGEGRTPNLKQAALPLPVGH